jgi:DNA (cytosine-5)-methyltransferase 1
MNYYNDNDKFAAQWLRNLIDAGNIPRGIVDERGIEQIKPNELEGFNQCHFFAGIAGWSRAIELAGIASDFPIWTGSCPCQPFSSAGRRKGSSDVRNLWHIWFELIRIRKPAIVFGEQVEAAISLGWLDRVFDDLEKIGYKTWTCVLPACGVGAPHIRSRLWWAAWLANAESIGWRKGFTESNNEGETGIVDGGAISGMANADCGRFSKRQSEKQAVSEFSKDGYGGGLVDAESSGWFAGINSGEIFISRGNGAQNRQSGEQSRFRIGASGGNIDTRTNGTNKHCHTWDESDWKYCGDGKYRRIPCAESGICPVASRVPGRVGQLRAYGNSIVPQVAKEFIIAVLSEIEGL